MENHTVDSDPGFNNLRQDGLRIVFADRHWMHIWKVGHKDCIVCNKDARVIASYVDASGEIMKQEYLCELHGPWTGRSGRGPTIADENTTIDDVVNGLKFGLGGTFSIRPE